MTKAEVSQKLGVSINTVDRWLLNGLFTAEGKRFKLKSEKRGRRVYVSEKDFNEFVKVREGLK